MKLFIKLNLGILFLALLALSSCRNPDNEILPTCFDGIKNQGEERVDCGGPNCDPCLPDCFDNVQNQDEQSPVTNANVRGIDCGGENCPPCSTCDDGIQNAHWVRDNNLTPEDIGKPDVGQGAYGQLYRLVMEPGIDCGFPCPTVCEPSPFDGVQNGDEEGVDCGGTHPDSPPCPPATCFDGLHNGTETGIDCGDLDGFCPDCPEPTCDDGIQNTHIELVDSQKGYIVVVETGIDCDNSPLTSCPQCPMPTCFDGIQNQGETGIDCGGVCETLCDPEPNCNNGIKDGNELGVDCGGPDCPPCPTCNDGIKNGFEYDIDCLDYDFIAELISQNALPFGYDENCDICPSCHDGILNEGDDDLYELDVDCGGPNCEPCEQFVTVASIGKGTSGAKFRDQYSYNKLRAAMNQTDTLSLDHDLYPGLKITRDPGNFAGDPFLKIEANQGIAIDANTTFIRTVTIFVPIPSDIPTDELLTAIPMTNEPAPESFSGSGSCAADLTGTVKTPIIEYREKIIQNNLADKCFKSYVEGTENSRLNFTYLGGSELHGEYYTKGVINQGSLRTRDDFQTGMTLGKFTDLEFKAQYPAW